MHTVYVKYVFPIFMKKYNAHKNKLHIQNHLSIDAHITHIETANPLQKVTVYYFLSLITEVVFF